jgi:branched-chain amino acid transport system substrate-binding protein
MKATVLGKRLDATFVGLGILLVLVLTSPVSNSIAAEKLIRIGFAHVFSGGMATFGQVAKQGAELAVKEVNQAGGINGRKVVIVYGDTAVKPAIAVKAVDKLVNEENVDVVIGMVSSAVAKKVTVLMKDLKCPLIVTHAMGHEITGSLCNPWTFRMTWNLDQCYKGAALLAQTLPAKKWTTVGPNYGFGQDSWKYFTKYLKPMGDFGFDEGLFTPLATKDWQPVIEKLKATGSDGIMVSLWGNNLKSFLKQAKKDGFFEGKHVVCPVGGSVEIFTALGFLNMPIGVWVGSPYWFEAYDNEFNDKFVKSYRDLSASRVSPSYAAYNSYAAVKMFCAAVAESGTSDREAVAKTLSGFTLNDLPTGPTTFLAEDHQAVFKVSFGKTSKHAAKGSKRIRGLDPIVKYTGAEVTPPVAESDCRIMHSKN